MEIRKLEINDLETRVEFLNNKEISQYLNVDEVFNIDKTRKWFEYAKNDSSRYDCVFEVEGNIIGMGGVTNISQKDQTGSLYIYLAPQYWGCGYGFTAFSSLCSIGFDTLELNRLYFYAFEENVRGNKLFNRVGFKLEGILREHTMHNGVLCNRYIYGLLKKDYK